MLVWTLLLGVASAAVVQSPASPLLCSQLKPLDNITLAQFEGHWVLLAIYPFTDGVSEAAEPESSEECNWYLYENATATSVEELMEESVSNHWGEAPDVYRSTITINPSEPGRWKFNDSNPEDAEGSLEPAEDDSPIDDMVIVAAEPASYLVAANCEPASSTLPEERRFVKGVSVMGRREGRRGPLLVDAKTLQELEARAVQAVGFEPKEPHIRQRTEC